jgi:hypothetical protein
MSTLNSIEAGGLMITDKITDGCDGRNHCLVKRHNFINQLKFFLFRFWSWVNRWKAAFKLIARNLSLPNYRRVCV